MKWKLVIIDSIITEKSFKIYISAHSETAFPLSYAFLMLATVILSEYGCDLNNRKQGSCLWTTSPSRNKSDMSTEIDGFVSKPSQTIWNVIISNMSSPKNNPCYVHTPPHHCMPIFKAKRYWSSGPCIPLTSTAAILSWFAYLLQSLPDCNVLQIPQWVKSCDPHQTICPHLY